MMANFADAELSVGSVVVTLVVSAVSLAYYVLAGPASNSVTKEEQKHWDEARRRRRVLIEEAVKSVKEGKENQVRIWEALYDEAESSFVTAPPFALGSDLPGLPSNWFPVLTQALGDVLASALQTSSEALQVAEDQVQRCLQEETSGCVRNQKALDARRQERSERLEQLSDLVKRVDHVSKAYRSERAQAELPKKLPVELERARLLLVQQERIRRGLTWVIGKQIMDAQIGGWLVLGVTFKVLMGAPAPLQVLALSDAARGMAKGGDEGYQDFVTAIGNGFLLFCIEKLLQFLARITMLRGESLFTLKLQRKVYSRMLEQDYEFFDGKPTAVLQNLVHESTEKVCANLIFMRVRVIQVIATVFFQVVLIAWRFPELALVVNMSLPIAGCLRYYSKGYIERAGARLKARGNIAGQRTWDVLSNLPTVRGHCWESGAVEEYSRCMTYQARINTKLNILNGITQPFLHFCDTICVYIGYYYGGTLIRSGSLTTAELVTLIRQFQIVAGELSAMLDTIANSMLATEHGRDILDLLLSRPKIEPRLFCNGSTELRPRDRKVSGKLANTEVVFKEVTFAYPGAAARNGESDALVFKGVSFTARHGECTALVGRTGCGKSTATLLLQRLYDVGSGSVSVGGVDVRDQDVHRLRRSIAVVAQEPVLFSTSICENLMFALADEDGSIALGQPEVEKRMIDACRRADAWEFVCKLPDGLRTDVGPRGSQLSGGQKQRLTIARAILKDAPLLVLDEATSSLDVEAERTIQRALDGLLSASGCGVTRLVVAHRLSTVRCADKIVVIQGGQVQEEGPHEQLLSIDGGIYSRFLRLSQGEASILDQATPEGSEVAISPVTAGRSVAPCVCEGAQPAVAASDAKEFEDGPADPPASAGSPPKHGDDTGARSSKELYLATTGPSSKDVTQGAVNGSTAPTSVSAAFEEMRQSLALLRAEIVQNGHVGSSNTGLEEVERCQERLGDLLRNS